MNKHIVKHIVNEHIVPCLNADLLWVLQGQCFILGALCPSKSGLMKKHIVKHIGESMKTNESNVSKKCQCLRGQ